jgi:two-component system OmpR family sensor kinase
LAHAVNRARALTNQLLKLAEVHSGKEIPVTADVDLQAAILQVVAGLVPAASAKAIEFVVNARISATVHASPIDVATLLAVLVENAVRYSAAGSPVEVTLSRDNAEATIEIADRGIGIPVDALPRIYDRFFRAAPPAVEGSGLGLSIAKAIADQYGFILSIANRVGGGVVAAVTFRLPASAAVQ